MLTLTKHLDKDVFLPRTYVVASTDSMGAQKAQTAEQEFAGHQVPCCGDAAISYRGIAISALTRPCSAIWPLQSLLLT